MISVKNLPEFCIGCMSCFNNGHESCPHSKYTMPILEKLLSADDIIFTSPVFVLQASGGVKAFLDHFEFMFLVHRARPEMFMKKAFILKATSLQTAIGFIGKSKVGLRGLRFDVVCKF